MKKTYAYFLQVIYWITNATVASFTIVYLATALNNDVLVGVMISLMGLFSILLNTIFEKRYILSKEISIRKLLLCIYGLALLCYLIYGYTRCNILLRAFLYCAGYSLFSYSHQYINIYAAKINDNSRIKDGNRPITLGPLYYSMMVLVIGYWFVRESPLVYINFSAVFVFISFLSILFCKYDFMYCKQREIDVKLKSDYRFILFVIASVLSSMAAVTSIKFISRIVISNGGNMLNLALLFAIQSTVVIFANIYSKKILEKISSETLLLFSFVFSFIKVFLIYISKDLNLMYLAMVLSIISYGSLGFASYDYLSKIIEKQYLAKANKISHLCSSINIGSLLSGFICSYVLYYYDVRMLLFVSCICAFCSILIFAGGLSCNK